MTDENRGGGSGEHPDLLPWLASGHLETAAAGAVGKHAERCPDCRRELEALIALKETMRRHDRTDHLSIPDLVAHEAGEAAPSGVTGSVIEAHLTSCSGCSEESAALRRVREAIRSQSSSGSDAIRPERRSIWRRPEILAPALAAVVAILLPLGFLVVRGMPGGTVRMAPLSEVTFSPSLRGETSRPTLTGDGPWAVTVLLPLGAAQDRYSVSIERSDGAPVRGFSIETAAARQGTLTILVPRLPASGDYILRVRAAATTITDSIDYPFATSR